MMKSLRQFPFSWVCRAVPLFAVLALLWPEFARAGYSIKAPLADGFDQAVGKPDAKGYYIFRGFWPNGHLGEDWNGNGGGDTDMGDPVYAIADGVVVFSDDYKRRWGNVVIVRHAYREKNGSTVFVDSLYGHLDKRQVRMYQVVKRGQQIGTIGNCHGVYAAHLHLEIRKNLKIGMNRSAFAKDYSNYYSPRSFIAEHRSMSGRGETVSIPVDSFGATNPDEPRESGTEPPPNVAKNAPKVNIPTRMTPKANPEEDRRKDLNEQLRLLAEENKKKTESIKDEDMDGFWSKLKNKLGKK
ncbi:MAG: M23 family metallopeptidase [Verrucomicrobia bacterium]|nr:M23 family metallopeptidase [Verrucomicrobiota bacterium]